MDLFPLAYALSCIPTATAVQRGTIRAVKHHVRMSIRLESAASSGTLCPLPDTQTCIAATVTLGITLLANRTHDIATSNKPLVCCAGKPHG